MNVTTIIVPLDGSTLAEAALPYAEALATATKASLALIAVVEREETGWLGVADDIAAHLERARWQSLEHYLSATVTGLRERGFEVSTTVTAGDPADEIVAAADADPGAMIVICTHGRGGITRWAIGSVADKVMRLSTRPVLMVRSEDEGQGRRLVALRRLMVPLDGSPLAEAVLPLAADLARTVGAEIVLVRVEPWLAVMAPEYGYYPDMGRIDAEIAADAKQYLEETRRRLPTDIDVKTIVLRGGPAALLTEFARTEGIDLVIMSTHGRGGFKRLVMGSTADRMVRSGAPVLLIRPHETREIVPRVSGEQPARRCATCGRLITFAVEDATQCPRCRTHLHTCANCVYWDQFACILQRKEAHDPAWPGRHCPRFTFRETTAIPDTSTRPA
jgi:nucleotide-binding universal stress UspA family protein